MPTDLLRTNQLSPEAYRWYLDYLGAMDRKDLDAYGAFLADGCALQMNNQPSTVGKEAVLRGLGAYWRSFGGVEHDLENIYGDDRRFAFQAVHMIADGDYIGNWKDGDPRKSKLVFIGRDLNRPVLRRGFEACQVDDPAKAAAV